MALRLNPLSTAKGKRYVCELCGKAATLACQHCRVTYYCAKEHQSIDWFGIHDKICQLLGALRTLRPTLGSEDERQRRNLTVQMSQHALIDLCKNEAQKHLVMGQYELAIPGALQSLRFSMEVYGSGRIELVPAYLLLAEANLGLKRYKVAEEFLLYANWSVLKNPDCSNELKSALYRNFGKLYASQGRFGDALKQLSLDVYYCSLDSGPEHIDTAGGYFYMADVFLTQGAVENALALYDKVVDIYYKFLINLRNRPDESISDYLSEAHIGEAVEMLRSILETRKKQLGTEHIASGEAAYTLGILKHITGFDLDARQHYEAALEIYKKQLGADNESTKAIMDAIMELPPIQKPLPHTQSIEEAKEQQNQQKLPALPPAANNANTPNTSLSSTTVASQPSNAPSSHNQTPKQSPHTLSSEAAIITKTENEEKDAGEEEEEDEEAENASQTTAAAPLNDSTITDDEKEAAAVASASPHLSAPLSVASSNPVVSDHDDDEEGEGDAGAAVDAAADGESDGAEEDAAAEADDGGDDEDIGDDNDGEGNEELDEDDDAGDDN